MGAIDTLVQNGGYIVYNKTLANVFGIEVALVFGELASICSLYGDSEFYCAEQRICKDTALSKYKVSQALKILREHNLISTIRKGMPAKNYYTMNENELYKMLETATIANNDEKIINDSCSCSMVEQQDVQPLDNKMFKNQTSSCSMVEQQDVQPLDNIITINNNNNNNNKREIKKRKSERGTVQNYDDILNSINDENLKTAYRDFIDMRKAIKKPLTVKALEMIIKRVNKLAPDTTIQVEILNQSTLHNWQDVYELKSNERQNVKNETQKNEFQGSYYKQAVL